MASNDESEEFHSLADCFDHLASNSKDYFVPWSIPIIEEIPSALEFYRQWVSPNIPVILKNAIHHWPAIVKWTPDYLREKLGTKLVTVAVTPNGYADAVFNDFFVLPEERKILFSLFMDIIDKNLKEQESGVFYIQQQNSNFTTDFKELHEDVEIELPWASEAFGKKPDAINFWLGEEAAVTSLHKDHYENIYCVISGEKTFTLYPPTDFPWIPYKKYPVARYKSKNNGDGFDVVPTGTNKVPWIPVDVLNVDYGEYPEFAKATALRCKLEAGDVLYLPSLWFHHVQQTQGCIAVNFWYDMEFDCKFVYNKFLQSTIQLQKSQS